MAPTPGSVGELAYVATPLEGGCIVEGNAPLSALEADVRDSVGFEVALADEDQTADLPDHSWAVKQAMLYPHDPNFAFWGDARGLGRLVIER